MGMYDTFIFDDNRILECGTDTTDRDFQTKDMECLLDVFKIQNNHSVILKSAGVELHGIYQVCDFVDKKLIRWKFTFNGGNFISSEKITARMYK